MIIHVLKNGEELDSIEGREVARDEAPEAYEMMKRLNQEAGR